MMRSVNHSNNHLLALLVVFASIVLISTNAQEDPTPAPIPACSAGYFQCMDDGETDVGPVNSEESCQDACLTCEGSAFFCPDFKVSEREESVTFYDDDYYYSINKDNNTTEAEDPDVLDTRMVDGNNQTVVEANASTTAVTMDVFDANSSTIIMIQRSYDCQCFPVFTDTTSCERTKKRIPLCRDKNFMAPDSEITSAAVAAVGVKAAKQTTIWTMAFVVSGLACALVL